MSDDLSAFFAKKKDKKKKTVVKMDDVGQILERKARRQEEHDQQVAEAEKRTGDDEPKRSLNGEESEWIEYGDSVQGRLEGLKIKDMGAESENAEEEQHENEDQKEQQEAVRTWGQVDLKKKEENDVETAADMANYQKQNARPDIFVPSCLRSGGGGGGERYHRADIDVSNQEMFPSLADASKMEKDKKEDKTGGGWVKTGPSMDNRGPRVTGPPASAMRDREQALATAKAFGANENTISRPSAPAPPPTSTSSSSSNTADRKYIPPHLRS